MKKKYIYIKKKNIIIWIRSWISKQKLGSYLLVAYSLSNSNKRKKKSIYIILWLHCIALYIYIKKKIEKLLVLAMIMPISQKYKVRVHYYYWIANRQPVNKKPTSVCLFNFWFRLLCFFIYIYIFIYIYKSNLTGYLIIRM